MPDLRVRRYHPDDRDRVRALHVAALKHAGAYFGAGAADEDLDRIEATYLDSGGEFLVGEADDRVVAMGAFLPAAAGDVPDPFAPLPPASGLIKRMRVDPDCHREGYGQAIYDELEERARAAGIETLFLDTTGRQTAAQAFYEANGFTVADRLQVDPDAVPALPDGEGFDLLWYSKEL